MFVSDRFCAKKYIFVGSDIGFAFRVYFSIGIFHTVETHFPEAKEVS